eukprot:TRINITY_DN16061_c0_g1_i1.p1 TRINITY_DN16061_c0_g1~~TRINITY_DN16061_c0_g1_i1.p1  ORF type:complete len:792 (+),score=77.76 TRINITY_DN16061_c0_g1_i1:105-2480(+)
MRTAGDLLCLIIIVFFFFSGVTIAQNNTQSNVTVTNTTNTRSLYSSNSTNSSNSSNPSQLGLGLIGVENDGLLLFAHEVINKINQNKTLLPNYNLTILTSSDSNSTRQSNNGILDAINLGAVGIVGPSNSTQAKLVAVSAGDYNETMISYYAGAPELSDKSIYPFFFRTSPSDTFQGQAIADLCHFYKWSDIFLIAENTEFGLGLVSSFIDRANLNNVSVIEVFFISLTLTRYEDALLEARNQGARIIVILSSLPTFKSFILAANRFNMIGFPYVYVGTTAITDAFFKDADGNPDPAIAPLCQGILTIGDRAVDFSNPYVASFTDVRSLPLRFQYLSTTLYSYAHALDLILEKMKASPSQISGTTLTQALRNISFVDLVFPADTPVRFNLLGDKINPHFTVYNFNSTGRMNVGTWTNGTITTTKPILWPVGFANNKVPDSTPRGTVLYLYCPDGEVRNDTRGIIYYDSVVGDPTYVESDSLCDGIVDCNNFSDESFDCDPSLAIGYVITSIIAAFGYIYLIVCLFLIFWFRRSGRIRAVGSTFLIVADLTCIAGITAIFCYIGKPSSALCAFRPWILCIPSGLLIGALAVRQYRVWRVYGNKSINPIPFSEFKLLLITFALIVPDLILLVCWTAFDTLEATQEDGNHLLCTSDYEVVFYVLFLSYKALISIASCILAVLTRNFPGAYSDARLIGFALYNESIVGAILIPIIFVLNTEYFIQWILITLGILFYYLSTFSIVMIPKIYGLLVVDKGRVSTDDNMLMPQSHVPTGRSNDSESNSRPAKPKSTKS